MEERYVRNIGPLTEADCACLGEKTVFIAGLGGLGGYIADILLRVGVGHIRAADGDVFEPSNLNRQLLSGTDVIGESKAGAAAKYAARVNPGVSFRAYDEYITEDNVSRLIAGCDAVLDALDNVPSRKLLKAECDRQGIPYIYGAVSGWMAQAALSLPGDSLLDALYPAELKTENAGVLPFAPALCAALQGALCVKLLCGKPLDCGKLYCFDLSEMEFEKLL